MYYFSHFTRFIYFKRKKDTPLIYFWRENDTHSYTGWPEKYYFQPFTSVYTFIMAWSPWCNFDILHTCQVSLFRRETPSFWPHLPPEHSSPSWKGKRGRLPLFDPISLLNIHLPLERGKLPLFGSHLLPIIFSLKRVNCIEFCNENALVSQQSIHKVRTIIKCYASYMYDEFQDNIRRQYLIISKFQHKFECWWTKLMSQNGFMQNIPLWQNAKGEISLFWTFPTWHVCIVVSKQGSSALD